MLKVQHFFDIETHTLSYIIYDTHSRDAVVIDPVLNFDPASLKISNTSLNKLCSFIEKNQLKLHLCLESHVHADHLSSAHFLKQKFPHIKIAISEKILNVQQTFKELFKFTEYMQDGADFDLLLKDQQNLRAGSLEFKVIATPGHTPACTCFLIDEMLFTGDTLFMPDFGTGRCDFPDGSAESLFKSIQKLYQLPPTTKFFVGHDYAPNGREIQFQSTIAESKTSNIHIQMETTKEEFVLFRERRDATLTNPKLLFQAIQVNMQAGKLPKDGNLKLPLQLSK